MAVPAEFVVEREGRPAALLDDPQLNDMFWFAWRITPAPDDPRRRTAVSADDFWVEAAWEKTVFRCKRSGVVAACAF